MANPEPLRAFISWRRWLTPTFVVKRYPRGFWLLLNAICEINKGYYPTAPLGVESLAKRTGLSSRYVERMRDRLEADGVLQLVEQSVGGRFSEDSRPGAPGRANVYQLGPLVQRLPMKKEPRSTDRGITPVYRPRFGGGEPRSTDRGMNAGEPRSVDRPTHALSADKETSGVFTRGMETRGGMGRGKEPNPSFVQPLAACRYCLSTTGHHDWCQSLNQGSQT